MRLNGGLEGLGKPALDSGGRPVHKRGVVIAVPGLYFLGQHFQHALTSSLLGCAGEDTAYLAGRMAEKAS